MGLSSHQSARMKNDEWLTPPEILEALGRFDLDPCAPVARPWDTAEKHYTIHDNGLLQAWHGRVWCNPPFGLEAIKWMRRMVEHGDGIALIPARTETAMFYETVWDAADAVLFIKSRPHFHVSKETSFQIAGKNIDVPAGGKAPCNSGAPICLVAYGIHNVAALARSKLGICLPIVRTKEQRNVEHQSDY